MITADCMDILDALSEGVVLIASGQVRFVNRAAVELLEVDLADALGLPAIAVLRDHRLEEVYLRGTELELETRGRVLLARAIPGGLALLDVSEAKRARSEARELLAVLSHELRTPATAIRATLEALQYPLSPQEQTRFLACAVAETERLVRLLEDLTVEVKPPQLRRIVLGEVVARAKSLLEGTFKAHGVSVETEVPELTVLADVDKLLQVLINLLENAAIHGPSDKTICLRAAEGSERVIVTIRDEGEPLSPETIEKLFEPHTRGMGLKSKGSGLGLYIVRSIVKRWGGSAWGRPLEAGNEFGFSVPRIR